MVNCALKVVNKDLQRRAYFNYFNKSIVCNSNTASSADKRLSGYRSFRMRSYIKVILSSCINVVLFFTDNKDKAPHYGKFNILLFI